MVTQGEVLAGDREIGGTHGRQKVLVDGVLLNNR
jgi:hypothetical protein